MYDFSFDVCSSYYDHTSDRIRSKKQRQHLPLSRAYLYS